MSYNDKYKVLGPTWDCSLEGNEGYTYELDVEVLNKDELDKETICDILISSGFFYDDSDEDEIASYATIILNLINEGDYVVNDEDEEIPGISEDLLASVLTHLVEHNYISNGFYRRLHYYQDKYERYWEQDKAFEKIVKDNTQPDTFTLDEAIEALIKEGTLQKIADNTYKINHKELD